jgi:hypothetical protein
VVLHALDAFVGADEDLSALFTDDVRGWSPRLGVTNLDELAEALADRDEAMSNAVITVTGLDVAGDKAFAEWRLDADHTGPLYVGPDLVAEPTNRHVHMAGATVAEFEGDRIKEFRTYFDDVALVEQVLVAG